MDLAMRKALTATTLNNTRTAVSNQCLRSQLIRLPFPREILKDTEQLVVAEPSHQCKLRVRALPAHHLPPGVSGSRVLAEQDFPPWPTSPKGIVKLALTDGKLAA